MQKEKFASQADPAVLLAVRAIAEAEGRQFQAVIDEALRDLVEKKRNSKARPHVLAAFEHIAKKRDWLYTQLQFTQGRQTSSGAGRPSHW